ncbi:MAG: YafY family transcriptional regulator [Actinomycetota bacterium]|nr:YafY family transcriptional regulator [Actinomycetota bacterium]
MSNPTSRVLRLLSLLQTQRFWPGRELAANVGVSGRTLRRDVERLRELGYPVDATPGTGGGYRLAAGAHMPPLLLDDDEAVAIAVGLRVGAGSAVAGIEATSLRALAKLEQVLPDRLRRRVRALHSNVVPLWWGNAGAPTVDAEALTVLAQACRDHEQVRFEYQRRDGEQGSRLVEPHQLVSTLRRWYLVAWDVRRDDWRTFRVDRMEAPRLAGVRFAARALPATDAAEFVSRSLRSMPMRHHVTVVAHCTSEAAAEPLRWADADVEAIDDHTSRVSIRADSLEWLVATIVMLAAVADIEVHEPTEVVAACEISRPASPGPPLRAGALLRVPHRSRQTI